MLRAVRAVEERTQGDLGPAGRALEAILASGIKALASDLHLDPHPGGTRVRFRVDGFFEDQEGETGVPHERLIARLKVAAGLTVYRRNEIQEGSIRREGGIDLRVSILPTVAGEKATIRIFDPAARPLNLEELAFEPSQSAALSRFAAGRQGTFLVAGPSGSGKTTTLYAAAERVRTSRGAYKNICSVEDPVELAVAGIHQVQVSRERGLTFARALSAILRQDPEVILVGEIRDPETAAIAVEAGMTGHLVLSSIHAGSAPEAVVRLLDLGVEPYALAGSLRGVVAQRLVRRICASCAGPDEPRPEVMEAAGFPEGGGWRRGAGCPACRGTGYRGRLPVSELMEVGPELAEGMRKQGSSAVSSRALMGGRTLLDGGIARARAGETTLEEVARVAGRQERGR